MKPVVTRCSISMNTSTRCCLLCRIATRWRRSTKSRWPTSHWRAQHVPDRLVVAVRRSSGSVCESGNERALGQGEDKARSRTLNWRSSTTKTSASLVFGAAVERQSDQSMLEEALLHRSRGIDGIARATAVTAVRGTIGQRFVVSSTWSCVGSSPRDVAVCGVHLSLACVSFLFLLYFGERCYWTHEQQHASADTSSSTGGRVSSAGRWPNRWPDGRNPWPDGPSTIFKHDAKLVTR